MGLVLLYYTLEHPLEKRWHGYIARPSCVRRKESVEERATRRDLTGECVDLASLDTSSGVRSSSGVAVTVAENPEEEVNGCWSGNEAKRRRRRGRTW